MISAWQKSTPLPKTFHDIECWVFDLDNTLYSKRCNLFLEISQRISLFVQEQFGLERDKACELQKRLFRQYGTTLRGLMVEYDTDPNQFLNFVHDIDYSILPANPELRLLLDALPGKKYIYTNATRHHSEKVLARIGVTKCFSGIFDIVAADWIPKPVGEAYDHMFSYFPINGKAAMVEDMACNLTPARERNMSTILILGGKNSIPEAAPNPEYPPDIVIDDLNVFLQAVLDHSISAH